MNTEEIINVISNKELNKRFTKLCKDNWKVKKMAEGLDFTDVKGIIDNWWNASRPNLLKLLKLKENKDYKFVYHELDIINQEDKL